MTHLRKVPRKLFIKTPYGRKTSGSEHAFCCMINLKGGEFFIQTCAVGLLAYGNWLELVVEVDTEMPDWISGIPVAI